MTLKDEITKCMTGLAYREPMTRFIGYNTAKGSRMYGTLEAVPVKQCIEAPVAENLMMGLAMGMSLEGYLPVVCFERHDFILLALDAIVNHLDKLPSMSGGQFDFKVIVRAIVGSRKPLDAGPQHTQDYTNELQTMTKNILVLCPSCDSLPYTDAWSMALANKGSTIIVEYRDKYDYKLAKLSVTAHRKATGACE